MRWVTRQGARVDRVACPWLIKRFVDPDAVFLFVPADQVQAVAKAQGATPFDAPGMELGHQGGKCSFEAILAKYKLADPALHRLALIVHGADIAEDISIVSEAAGLKAFSDGLHDLYPDDHLKLAVAFPLYDALFACCQRMTQKP